MARSNMPDVSLAALLQRTLDRRHHTQGQAAESMGVRQQLVSGWLAGVRPKPENIERLASYLGVAEDEVIDTLPRPRGRQRNGVDERLERLEGDLADLRRLIIDVREELRQGRSADGRATPRGSR